MKKLLYLMVAIIFVSGASFADFTGSSNYPAAPGGFNGSVNYSVSPIKDVMGMYDDQVAVVQGNIVKRLSEDKYLFKDATGEMVVEIDYKYWAGVQADEKTVLELTGKVDRDYNAISLDVFMVKKIK